MKYLYMAVTNDKYQLPIVVEERGKDLADKLGINYNTLRTAIWQKSKVQKLNCKCIRIEV